MVLPQNPDLAVGISQSVAVREERQLDEEGDGNGDYRGEVKLASL